MKYTYVVYYNNVRCEIRDTVGCGIIETMSDGTKMICFLNGKRMFNTVYDLFKALKKYDLFSMHKSHGYIFKESTKIKFDTYEDLINVCPEYLI